MLDTGLLAKIRHAHDDDNQTRPTGEMLGPLARTGLGIILFPSEARAFPFVEDIGDEIRAQLGVDLCGLGFDLCGRRVRLGDGQQVLDDEIVHVDPDGGAPVVLVGAVGGEALERERIP